MSFEPDNVEHEIDIRSLLCQQIDLLQQIALAADPLGALPVRLMGNGSQQVKVNEAGELLISDGPYDLVTFNELGTINTAYNYFKPRGREQFVITGFLAYGDKQVNSSTNATLYKGREYFIQCDKFNIYGYMPTSAEMEEYSLKIGSKNIKPIPYRTESQRKHIINIFTKT